MMKVYLTEDVAWSGKFYPAGQLAEVPDDLGKALTVFTPLPSNEEELEEAEGDKPDKKRSHRKPVESGKPDGIKTEV